MGRGSHYGDSLMDARRAEIWLEGLKQGQLDHLIGADITINTLIHPTPVLATRGTRAHDGRFDYDRRADPDWLAFEEEGDFVFWRPADGAVATAYGRSFALGEENIYNPGTYALDGWLEVFPTPLGWLQANRRGIVIVDWSRIFERLRDAPRILGATVPIAETIETLMHPARLPVVAAKVARRAGRKGRRE